MVRSLRIRSISTSRNIRWRIGHASTRAEAIAYDETGYRNQCSSHRDLTESRADADGSGLEAVEVMDAPTNVCVLWGQIVSGCRRWSFVEGRWVMEWVDEWWKGAHPARRDRIIEEVSRNQLPAVLTNRSLRTRDVST